MKMYRQQALALLCGCLLGFGEALPSKPSVVLSTIAESTSYDFIIAGGGIAGLTLADRLTEEQDVHVLVIEAGPFDDHANDIAIPGFWNGTEYWWPGLMTSPLTALNNRTSMVIASKVVGGGSTLNAMNWLRGPIADYEGWESLGNEGWGWNGILPFFKKSENFTAPDQAYAARANISFDHSVRGNTGPVQYTYPDYYYPGSANWWNAALSIGLKQVQDTNGGVNNAGLFWPPYVLNNETQTRSDARTAHYDRVIATRPNYHLLPNNQVSRILFNGTRAIGVEYAPTAGGTQKLVYASKEVIVAAGGIFTPQLLQLSGVGPKALLNSLNIPIVSDLPGVGSNLQDQTTLPVPYDFTSLIVPNANTFAMNATYDAEQLRAYKARQSSAYSVVNGQGLTFGAVSLRDIDSYETIVAKAQAYDASQSLPRNVDSTVLAGYEAQRKIIIEQFQNPNISTGITLWNTANMADVFSLKPLSRGTVMINSTDITNPPVIDYRTATDPIDFDIIVAYLKKTRDLFRASSMKVMGPIEMAPLGPDVQTDEQIIAVARMTLVPTNAHQCCTAPMMPLALGGVVDASRKVYGVQGLRVGDVSAFPLALSAGPTPTVYGAAEKLAHMIKKEYGLY